MRNGGGMRRAVFGLGIAAALGFGGTQALAAPAGAARGAWCDERLCDLFCSSITGFGGTCQSGRCICPI
jgi:hypothetical protein